MDDNIKKLHQALIDDGYDDVGTEQEFRDYVSDSKNVATLYNALSEAGYDNFKDQKSLETYLSAKAPVAQKPSTPQSSGQSVYSKEKKQTQYPQEVIDAFNSPDNKPGNFKDLAQLNDEYQRGELKQPGLISQALGMLKPTEMSEKQQQRAKELPFAKRQEALANKQMDASLASPNAPVETIAGAMGVAGKQVADPINQWSAAYENYYGKEGVDPFQSVVQDIMSTGAGDEDPNVPVQMAYQALERFADRTAKAHTQALVANLPEGVSIDEGIENQWYSHDVQDKLQAEAKKMGISYDDYVALFLKPSLVQSLKQKIPSMKESDAEGIALRLFSHEDDMENRLFDKDIADMLGKYMDEPIDNAITKAGNEAKASLGDAINRAKENTGPLQQYELLKGILASNKLKDPERVKENLQGQIEDILTNTDITLDLVKLMDKKGLSYDKLDEVMQKRVYPAVMNVLESKLSDKYIQKYMPKGSLEYIVKSAINNTIAGKVYRKMTQSDYQNWLEDMAYQQYQPGFWERVGSGALTFAGDAWSYWVPGLAGGKLTKSIISRAEASLTRDLVSRGVAGQTAARLARIIVNRSKARMLGTGAVNGAVTFGGQQVISTPVDEGYRSGQFDENGNVYHTNVGKVVRTTAKNATRESLMGAVLQGGTVANMIGKGRGLAANILADVGGKAFDSALMTGSGILEQKMADPSYQVTGKGVAENFLESGANLLAISFPHIVRKYVNFKDAQAFNKAAGFNKDDIATMKKAGYGDLHSALEKLATVNPEYRTEGWMERELANAYADPSIKFGAGKNVEDKTAYLTDEYKNFLKDKAVPQTLKIKLQSVIEGKVPNRLPAIIDSRIVSTDDGKVNLETYDVDGNIVTRQVFDSKEKADEANNQITLQKDLNAISLSENLYEANVIRDKIQQSYNDAQEKYAMGKPLSDEEKSAVYLYQQANHVTSLRSKLADVRSLTPEEQRVSLNDNDRRFIETYEKMLGEFKGNQDSELSDYIHNFETSLGLKRGSTHRALEGHTKEEADRIVALNKSNARNSEFKNGVTYHSLYEPDGKDGETTFIPIGNGRYRTVMEQRIVDAYRNQLLNDVGIRTEMRETEKEISNPNEEVESIPEQVSPVNSSLATENTEAETTQPQGGANISPEVAPQEEQPTPSGDGTASADGTSSGQESPVSSEPAPYQDRTKTVPTPNNAEFAANPANVSNSSAEGASPETKVAGSDAFVMGQNAYKNGDTEGLKSIKYNAETAELRLKRAFANDTDRIQGVYNAVNKGTDIETYIEQRTNYLTPFQQEAIRKYAEAMDANKGAMDALEHADDGYADMLKQQLSQYTMENGNISSLTLTDGQRGYWKSKNEYGAGFGIFPDANGQPVVKQVPSSQVKENGKEIPLQEYVNQLVTQKHEATKKNFNAIFDATSLKPNDTVSLSINDKDQPTEAKIVSVNPDGTISFNIAGSKNVTTVPVDTFNKFQKYALRNSINAELDAEDAERAEKEAIKAEAEKKQRFANGIVGLSEQKPDYSSKETDAKVAAEYLQEQYADNHDQLIKLVNGSRSDIKEQIDNIRKRIVEAEDWLDTNADLEPEQAQSREDKLKLAKEQLEDLTNRYDNWNKIRSLIMTDEEKRDLKDERTANIKKVGIDKEALTVTDEREVPVLTDEELKKQYPTMDEASDYILSQRKEISKTQEELHRQLEDIDDRLNQYLLGESDLTDEEIRDFNTTKAALEARMANLTESAKELKAQADKLKKLYVQENKKERAAILAEMTPAEQRRVKAEQYLNDGNISGLMKLYADTSVDFTDDHPYTVDEYVASSIGRHALNYEGREVNGTFLNGLQQEFGGTRKDLEKIQVLAAEGKGQTFDKYVNGLYDNLPDNLRNQGVNTQEIRNSLLALLRGAEKYSDLKNYILKEKIAHAEEEMRSMDLAEEEQRAAYEEEKEQQMQEQVDDVSAKYSLSSETAGNGEQFYQDAEGNIDLANVPQEVFEQIGYTAAPFRLTPKMIKHMMDRHNTELKFSSPDEAIDFVRDVMNNFDHVRLGYDGALVFSIEDGRRRTGKRAVTILINNDNGKFYGLKTSGYESVKGLEKRPLLWERGANEKTSSTDAATASVTTSKSSLSSEQSGSASHQGNDLNSSGGKDTNNSDNLQEKGTKFSEKLQNAIAETETKPTEAQKKAGNYKKGHLSFGGYDFTVETPKGVTRSGKDEQGKPWSVTMHDTYGYILGKIGVDGDHIDMFINDVADLDTFDGNVYVVDQVNPETGEFDEHKVMYGYPSEEAATEAYLANYSKGWKGLGKVTSVPKATFDKWLESSDRKTKPFADYTMVQTSLQKNNSSIQKDNPVIREARKRVSDALDALDKFKAEKQAFYKKIKGIFKNKPETDAIEEARKLIAKWRNDSYAVMSIDGFDYNQKYQGANLPGEVYRAYEKAYKAISGVDHKIEHVSGTGFIGTISDSAALEDYINGLYAMFIGGKLGKKFYLEDNLPEIQKQVYKIAEDDIKLGRVLSREGVKYYDPNLKYADPKLFDDPLVPNETFDGWLENPNKKQDDNLPFAPMNMDELPFHRDVKEVKPSDMTEAQKVAYDAVSTMLKKAGIPVKVVSNEDMEKVAEAQDNLAVEMLLNDPRLRFYIKTPEQKEAAKAAYDWAAKNRPDKFKQYAIVNMDNPNQPPQYFEKKDLAEKWRKYYTNAWKIGNYKAFNLNKPFEEQIKDIKGDVPSEFDPYKAESLLNKRIELEKQIKETEDSYNAKKKERADYQNQLMQDYMDQHGLSSENDIPDDVWTDYRNKSFEKYQDKLDSLFAKYKDLDRQLKAVAEPGVRFLRTYHGSGADFTEFDFDHMGEGEGSQAFGWGGYVTNSKEIGKDYTRRAKSRKANHAHFYANMGSLIANDWYEYFVKTANSESLEDAKEFVLKDLDIEIKVDENKLNRNEIPESKRANIVANLKEEKRIREIIANTKKEDLPNIASANLYEVDIPEDNGSNYLDWDAPITDELIDKVAKALPSLRSYDIKDLKKDRTFDNFYKTISMRSVTDDASFNDDKAASKLLASLGYTGIKYKAGRNFGGAEEGDTNYVIFKPEDMQIVDHNKFAKGKGTVYGYTDGNEIVLNQEHLNPNTPIHEYQHIWRTAAKAKNPELIEHGDNLIKQTEWFKNLQSDPNYNHLTDEQICDEAFARLTGDEGEAILEQMAKDAIKENPLDTAKELSVINKLKEWLKKFWYWTLETFTKWKPEDIKKMTLEDIRNLVLRDLANGVDPRNVLKGQMTKDEAVSLRQQMADNAEPERILEHTEDNWLQDFGKDGRVNTPIGSIKLGENQYKKAGREDRIKRFGLLKPTLERPDVILEKPAPKEGAERQTKYLFVKSFKKVDGTKILNFESITVKQGEDEVSISAHQIEPSKLLKELTESKMLWNRFRGDSNSLGENQGSALTPSANNPSGKDSVLNPHSDAKIRNSFEITKENGGNLSEKDKIKSISQQFGVDEADVAMYANAIKKGSTAEAARARANIKRHLLQANEDKISSFKELLKYTKPVNDALKENFGDLDAMIEERVQQVKAQRNAMEAARKRAEEEEAKRQKHLEELSLIPDDQLDKQYMDALAKGDDATAREMLDEAARRKGYDDTESAYQGVGAWAAPGNPGYESDKARRDDWESSGSDVNLEDMALGYTPQPDDYFSHPERYSQNTPHGLESVKAINTAIDAIKNGEKDVKVKVYRAVPTSVKEGKLRNGDWVTPSKIYAEMHGTNRLEGKYRIIEDEVPANQLWWDGNDANEFGFDDGKAYKYKNAKNNRKLNDLVTYDDKGDVITPSMRFNSRKQDVRFHRSDGANLPSEEDNKPKKKTERGRIDEATGAFKLAPNGEQSNLSKKQYIEARTKNFKEWFGGDWEKKPKDFKNKLDANGEPLEKYVEGYLNRPKKPTMPKKRKGEDEATFFGRKMLYSQALEDWPKTEADWKKRIDEFDENTLAALTPPDEESIREKYQKQYENDMASWRKDHPYIKEGEERPLEIPDMRDYQSIQDYGEALRKHEIWKTAPHKDEYDRMAEDEIISKVALMDAVQHPFSEYARLKAMKAEFQHMRHVMQNQKVYDQNTTDAVVQFAKRFMSLGYGDDLGRGSINTLLTIVKNSTGKKSYEISQQLYQVMDVLMNNQLRNFDRAVMKTMSIKELKENAKGIQVQGKLELRGQTTIKAFRDAVSSRISSDKLDEKISNLIDKMAADKKNASSYQDELLGLNLAKQYVDYIDSSRNDAIEIEDLKKLEIENYKDRKGIYKGELTKALLQEHLERLNQYDEALFNNKVERMDRYSQLLANLGGMIDESVKGAREFQERDARRAIKVKMMASADLGDKSMNQHHKENWKTRLSNSDVARLFCSPLGSFDALMREFGSKQINGEGQLWNHFVRGAMKASNDVFKSVREANNEIDLKVSELFGKVTEDKNGNKKGNMILNDLYALERSNKVKSLDVTIRDIEGEQTYKLQQGNLMYIYMVNKMPDGAMKLREMGILDADVERIKENIDPRFLKLADWIQGEFLPKMRTKYNKRHEELFGAPMPMVENYFPLRVLKNARYMEEDVNNTSDGSNALPSTATGAIIKRKTNKLPLDILNADALSVTIDNIKEMENWYNYAPIRKDANTLLSDTTFRNRVQNMTTIYGSGERLWNNVKDATAVAMGTYRPKGGTDLAVSIKNIGKGITGAKISGRLYTAFKQILSFPLFLADADLGRFAWYSVNPYGSFKWAIENMPNFDKRWSGRKLGDTVLMDDPTDWKLWHTNLMEKAAYYGMTPNALVDAVTCAVGARAVYDTKYKQYIKAGLTEERAKEKALSDAEINFNTSQQSSEGAFVSPMQLDRTLESAIFTPFRNSSMLYERKGINALRNLKHRFEKGHKEASIKYMAAQLMEEGVGYEQATKAAEKMYQKGLMHNIADAIVALWLGPIIWNLGGSLGYLIPYLGDDENKKKKMVIDAVILGLLEGPVDGLAGGQFINTAIANTITSDGISLKGLKNVDFSGMPMLSDFNSMIEKFGYDKVAGAQDLMFMVMQSATGFNPRTLTDAINACIDYGNGDMTNAKEIALFVFRLMNGPAATVDNLYIDELGMKGKDAKKLSYEELAKRYAEYKFGKNTFGLGKLYSDEEKQKKLKAIEKSFDKKVSERLAGMDREDLKNEFSESRSQKEKKLIGKIIADELETKDSEAVKKAKADASYLRQRNFSDLMDDLYLQKEWETTNAANAGLEELKGNGASEEEIEAYKTKHKAALDKREAIQEARKEMQEKKADISSDNDEATMAAIRKLRDSILKTVRQTKK